MDRRVADALNALPERNRFMKGLYAQGSAGPRPRPLCRTTARAGRPASACAAPGSLALLGLTSSPPRCCVCGAWSAARVALLALVYGAWITLDTILHGTDLEGWLIAGRRHHAVLGRTAHVHRLLGEYIGRIYEEVKRRPTYLVARDEDNSPWRDS